MTDKRAKVPGPDHPITIERNRARVVVVVAGRIVADTRDAVTLREASYAAVQYVPQKDVDMSALERSAHATFCPYKGDCAYYDISIDGRRSSNAVWTTRRPFLPSLRSEDTSPFIPNALIRSRNCTRPVRNGWRSQEGPMANVIEKHSISSELAQKMVNAAVAKARELRVTENVAILDDGGNLKAFSRMDGASIPTIEIAQNKAYTALFGVPTQDFFDFIQRDPSLLAGIPTLARVAAWGGGLPIKVNGEVVGAIGVSGAPTVQNDVDCARAALALVPEP